MKLTSLLLLVLPLSPAAAVVTLPFGDVTLVSTNAIVTGTIDPETFEFNPRTASFSITFEIDAAQDVYISRVASSHEAGILLDGNLLGTANIAQSIISVPSGAADTADWTFIGAGNSRAYTMSSSVTASETGDYAFQLFGLRWTDNLPASGTVSPLNDSSFRTSSLHLNAAPEPSLGLLLVTGLGACLIRRRR